MANKSPHASSTSDAKRQHTAAMLVRFFQIHQYLAQEAPCTAPMLAREFEVSERTVKRDIDTMRDLLGAPIAWVAEENRYRYTQPCDVLPLVRLEPVEAFALALAALTLAGSYAPSLGSAFGSALQKLTPMLGGAVSFPLEALAAIVSAPRAAAHDELRHIERLVRAILGKRAMKLSYQKPGGAQPELRTAHPLHLAHLDQRWTLIAWDPQKQALRHFLLVRIHELTFGAAAFTPPADFDAPRHLAGCMGRYAPTGDYEVRIALTGAAAANARDVKWQSSQTSTLRPDGRLEITLRLNNLVDVRHTILYWGAEAEAISPPELRQSVHEELQRALRLYAAPVPEKPRD